MGRRKSKGLLLIEAAFAIALLLLFFNTVVFTGTSQMRWSRDYGARARADRLVASSLSSMASDYASWSSGNQTTDSVTRDGVEFEVVKASESTSQGLLRLRATVSWNEGSRRLQATDQVLVSERE